MLRLLRGKRAPLSAAILAICVLFVAGAGIFAAFDLGIFDKMLLRFSSDKGSTLARYATFNLLSHFDWYELVLGPNPVRVNALQSQLGLNYGIENFWISCIVQFGIIHTALLTIGLGCFFTEVIRRSSSASAIFVRRRSRSACRFTTRCRMQATRWQRCSNSSLSCISGPNDAGP